MVINVIKMVQRTHKKETIKTNDSMNLLSLWKDQLTAQAMT
jgi:hypothetical protein